MVKIFFKTPLLALLVVEDVLSLFYKMFPFLLDVLVNHPFLSADSYKIFFESTEVKVVISPEVNYLFSCMI